MGQLACEDFVESRVGAACLGGDPSCGVRPGDLRSYVERTRCSRCV